MSYGASFLEYLKKLSHDASAAVRGRVVGRAKKVLYFRELKQMTVIELCTRQVSAQVIAQKLGVTMPTLYKWKD